MTKIELAKPKPMAIDTATARELHAVIMPEHEFVLHSIDKVQGDATALGLSCSCGDAIYLSDKQLVAATGHGASAWRARLRTLCRVDRPQA